MAYTTVSDVRPSFLQRREVQNGITSTTISLQRRGVVDVSKLTKNGSELTKVDSGPASGEFSYSEADNEVTLGDSATASDEFVITESIYMTDSEVSEVIDDVHSIIRSKLSAFFDLPLPENPDSLQEAERAIAAYTIIRRAAADVDMSVGDTELQTYKEEAQEAMVWLEDVLNGTADLLKSDDTAISRITEATEVGQHLAINDSGHGGTPAGEFHQQSR